MGKVNACLKRGFIIWTCLVGLLSVLLLAVTLFGHGYFIAEEEMDDVHTEFKVMYSIGIVTLILAIAGVYGAAKEKTWPLVVFVVGMGLTSLVLLVDFIGCLWLMSEVPEAVRKEHLALIPLYEANISEKEDFYKIQISLQCCGLEIGYEDWGDDIPNSCLCLEHHLTKCVVAPQNNSLSEYGVNNNTVMVFQEPCLPLLILSVELVLKVVVVLLVFLIVIWVVSTAMSSIILCQLRRKVVLPTVTYSSEAKAGNYTTLMDTVENE